MDNDFDLKVVLDKCPSAPATTRGWELMFPKSYVITIKTSPKTTNMNLCVAFKGSPFLPFAP